MNALVSVIVPIYNSGKFLRKCIDSLLIQSYQFLEIILIDDGSTDNSGDICKEYLKKDKRIKYFYKNNRGVSSARNMGLDVMTGEYVTFVDSDDYLEKNHIEDLLKDLLHEKADISICGYIREKEDGTIFDYTKGKKRVLHPKEAVNLLFKIKGFQGFSWNKLFKSKIINENKIKFNPEITIWEDMLFVLQYMLCSKVIVYSPRPTYHYIVNPKSVLGNRMKVFNYKNLTELKAAKIMLECLPEDYYKARKTLKKRFVQSNVGIFIQNIVTGNNDTSLETQLKKNIRKDLFLYLKSSNSIIGKQRYKIYAILISIHPGLFKKMILITRKIVVKIKKK